MKTSLLCSAIYPSRDLKLDWPVPPGGCDRATAAAGLHAAVEQAVRAEELGYDWASVSEHHYSPVLMTPNPVVLAATVAQATSTIQVALLGPLVPLVNPVRLAEEIALLDSLSGGRVVALFLRGTPNEHRTYGVDPAATREITEEGVELILRTWTEPEPFAWKGRHFDFATVSAWPRSLQDPHPPVFYSGNSVESAEFAARHGLGLAIGFMSTPALAERVSHYRRVAAEHGWEPTSEHVLYRARVAIDETDEAARARRERLAETLARLEKAPVTDGGGGGNPFAAGLEICGGPDTVAEQFAALREAGVGVVDVSFNLGSVRHADVLFAEKVIPQIRAI